MLRDTTGARSMRTTGVWRLLDATAAQRPTTVPSSEILRRIRVLIERSNSRIDCFRTIENVRFTGPSPHDLLAQAEAVVGRRYPYRRIVATARGRDEPSHAAPNELTPQDRLVDTRFTDQSLPPVGVAGEAFVLLPVQTVGEAALVLVDAGPVVRAMSALHELAWSHAFPSAGSGSRQPGPPVHLAGILAQAVSGATDRTAQRALNLSSRTYSRRMTELLGELNSQSRFQAGVEAARRGWV
jgi:hypothetical protein